MHWMKNYLFSVKSKLSTRDYLLKLEAIIYLKKPETNKPEVALNVMISLKLTWFGILQPRLKLYSLQHKNKKDLV